jgi:hypothetical protein
MKLPTLKIVLFIGNRKLDLIFFLPADMIANTTIQMAAVTEPYTRAPPLLLVLEFTLSVRTLKLKTVVKIVTPNITAHATI